MTDMDDSNLAHGIAVVSMAGRFPGARNTDEFWQNLQDGVESIISFTREELAAEINDPSLLNDPATVGAYGVLDDIELFDSEFFGFTPREAELLDPQQRIFLECAWEALERGAYDPSRYKGLVGVFAGSTMSSYVWNLLSHSELLNAGYGMQIVVSNEKDHLATRISYELDLKGPSISVQTACSTSLVAIHLACQSLLDYHCDIALAGGVSISVPQKRVSVYVKGGIDSPDGHCRAFDEKAAGTVGGNGAGVVLLKRFADALKDGDTILAVIRGSAINNDGSQKVGYTAPSVYGQAAVITAAQAAAEVDAETISYIEAHGSATALGDPIEIAALTRAFRATTKRRGFCAIGSVKTNVGHLDAAAGVASLIKVLLALNHGAIPPSLHFNRPNPHIDFENSPFYVNTKLSEWKANSRPRRAGVSSFGLGGTNAHLVVEEYRQDPASTPALASWQLLLLSARTSNALETATDNFVAHLSDNPDTNLADVAYTLQVGRRSFAQRRVVVCRDPQEAVSLLRERDARYVVDSNYEGSPPSVVFMFPGLGNHYIGMARDLYSGEPIFRKHVEHCCALLKPHLGVDLRDVIYPGWQNPGLKQQSGGNGTGKGNIDLRRMLGRSAGSERTEEEDEATRQLNQTQFTHPALFVIEYALAQFWLELGVRPQAMIGYSVGEYVAACVAGVMSLESALLVIAQRARMIQALPGGAMLAVPLSEHEVHSLLGNELHLAAVNGPSVCVLAGTDDAVYTAERRLTAKGVACRRLSTNHAFHSPSMAPIVERFTELMEDIPLQAPAIPFISNLTGQWITEAQATNAGYWARQMCEPVRFSEGLETLWAQQPASEMLLLEIGPGQTLNSWALQHPASVRLGQRLASLPSLRHSYEQGSDVAYLLRTLGKLWLAGLEIEWSKLYAPARRQRVPLPTYPFERHRYWIDKQQSSRPERHGSVRPLKSPDLADWFYLPLWKQSPLPAKPTTQEQPANCCLVFAAGCGLEQQLAGRLEEMGYEVVLVSPGEGFSRTSSQLFTIDPGARADYDRLLSELVAAGKYPRLIAHLWSVRREETFPDGKDRFQQAQQLGFYSLLCLTQELAAHGLAQNTLEEPLKLYVLSNNMQEVTGAEELCPEKAMLIGVCRSVPQEYPNVTCVSVDVVLPEPRTWREQRLVEQLAQEFSTPPSDLVVSYRENNRWVQIFEPVRLEQEGAAPLRLRKNGVYWLTGGLGRDSLVRARYLAETFQAKLVLSGRTALPQRHDWEQWLKTNADENEISIKIRKVLELEELGAEVLVLAADVASEKEMRDAVKQIIERFGELHGVIHAAGITTADLTKVIAEVSRSECEAHFQSKVYGLYVLEKVLQARSLDFCLLTSSIASILGGVGLLPYTAASNFMDGFVHRHNQTSPVTWTSLNWQGATPADTVDAFRRVLSMRPTTQVVVSAEDLHASIDQRIRLKFLRDAATHELTLHPRPLLRNTYVAPQSDIEKKIVEVWQALIGVEQIGIHDNFLELGGNSLLAMQLISRLGKIFGVELQVRNIFETPTVAELGQTIQRLQQPSPSASQKSLVKIQAGGARQPFFCVHPAGGNVFCYINLARHLGTDTPFYGLQSAGLSGTAMPSSVEEMAAQYLEELRAVVEFGASYLLGGWSMGGLVAYEMARQLQAQGEVVSLLALIDTSTTLGKSAEMDDLSVTASFAQELALTWNQRHTLTRAELQPLDPEQQLALIFDAARKTGNLPAGTGLDSIRQLLEVFKVNVRAMHDYIPQPIPGKVTLLNAEDDISAGRQQRDLGWGELAAGGVEIHLVPGNHYSVVQEPHSRSLAETLRGCISRAETLTEGINERNYE